MAQLTLTFDNGPTPGITERVLDILAAHGIKTTFFVIGRKLASSKAARACAERAHAEGHWIGNHTYTHMLPLGHVSTAERAVEEIALADREIGDLAHPGRLFRPYGGGGKIGAWLLSKATVEHIMATGYTVVLWNAIPRDWDDPEGWLDRALAQIDATPWPLMVLHDIEGACLKHLDRFLSLCADRGVVFRQDFPPDCAPIRRGTIVGDIAPITT